MTSFDAVECFCNFSHLHQHLEISSIVQDSPDVSWKVQDLRHI